MGFLAGGQHPNRPRRAGPSVARRLARAGAGEEELRLLTAFADQEGDAGVPRAATLTKVAEFVAAIGVAAAHDYFRAIAETRAVAELTDPRVLEFARSVDRHTAEWYFWAIWGTGAVRELTSETVLAARDFFGSMDSPATVEYFLAIRETKAAGPLTDRRVLDAARALGSDAAVEFFGACWETGAVQELTAPAVLALAEELGGEAAREYFRTIRETGAVAALTGLSVLGFARSAGSRVAQEYFRAVRTTKAVEALTGEHVLLFAELIGKGPVREYFRAISSTKAVSALTSEGVLRTSGVIRSIGREAALDYFLAVAEAKVAPPPPPTGGRGDAGPSPVPVLTLLDLPSYDRYRSAGLLGVSAAFWLGAWRWGGSPLGVAGGLPALLVACAAWLGLLLGVHLLLGAIAERSTEEFVRRRRQLLNEHGIRWHNCAETDPRCELCWSPAHTHEDGRFDDGRFCRCPAC